MREGEFGLRERGMGIGEMEMGVGRVGFGGAAAVPLGGGVVGRRGGARMTGGVGGSVWRSCMRCLPHWVREWVHYGLRQIPMSFVGRNAALLVALGCALLGGCVVVGVVLWKAGVFERELVLEPPSAPLSTVSKGIQEACRLIDGNCVSRGGGHRVVFVSPEIAGPDRSGGIGTAVLNAAVALRALEWDVSVLMVENGAFGPKRRFGEKEWTKWRQLMEEEYKLKLHVIRWQGGRCKEGGGEVEKGGVEWGGCVVDGLGEAASLSWWAWRWLETAEDAYEMAIFPDYLGLGFFSTQARRTGSGLKKTAVVVNTHGPLLWAREKSFQPVTAPDVAVDALERGSYQFADHVISPSAWLPKWLAEERGFHQLPAASADMSLQSFTPTPSNSDSPPSTSSTSSSSSSSSRLPLLRYPSDSEAKWLGERLAKVSVEGAEPLWKQNGLPKRIQSPSPDSLSLHDNAEGMQKVGRASTVMQNIILPPFPATHTSIRTWAGAAQLSTPSSTPLQRIIFFGRLEPRKGLVQFCKAVSLWLQRETQGGSHGSGSIPVKLTFLGADNWIGKKKSSTVIKEDFGSVWKEKFGLEVEVLVGLGSRAAQAELVESPGTLVVVPSIGDNSPYAVLEALVGEVALLGGADGGVPELVHPSDRQRCLTAPTPSDIAEHLSRALHHGVQRCRLQKAPLATLKEWIATLRTITQTAAQRQEVWEERESVGMSKKGAGRGGAVGGAVVSVIMTTYERGDLLEQAVQALAEQSAAQMRWNGRPLMELILVDDASESPSALEALQRVEEKWILPRASDGWKVIRAEHNGYVGKCRRIGVAATTAPLLFFVDDDDVARPFEVEALWRAQLRSGADVVVPFVDYFEGEAAPEPQLHKQPKSIPDWGFLGGTSVALGPFGNTFGPSRMLVRRETYLAVGGFHEMHGVAMEDWRFHARAAMLGANYVVLPIATFLKRGLGEHSMTHTTPPLQQLAVAADPYLDMMLPHPALRALMQYAQHHAYDIQQPIPLR